MLIWGERHKHPVYSNELEIFLEKKQEEAICVGRFYAVGMLRPIVLFNTRRADAGEKFCRYDWHTKSANVTYKGSPWEGR